MQNAPLDRPNHGHHKVAAAIFVSSLIVSAALILAAELMKPERFEFHPSSDAARYVIYDRETGRAATVEFNEKKPRELLKD
jgi:hypothetical protein